MRWRAATEAGTGRKYDSDQAGSAILIPYDTPVRAARPFTAPPHVRKEAP
ncbi:hypothetical protein HMPREF9946_00640 [Acetobacteraceae bacterium AT-5844]|nr:hypothetical protein HMPREF9946_00640 [Acetobacteraceae bacterium AT-5844]